jgi:hypothetical protein
MLPLSAGLDQACAIADGYPYERHGVVTYEMREWLLMEGGFALRVSFSQGSYAID